MRKREKAVLLGLVLSALVGTQSAEATVFGAGTYDIPAGTYSKADYILNVWGTANVTGKGDIVLEQTATSGGAVTIRANNGSTINMDMEGHNLTVINHNGDVGIQFANGGDGAPGYINMKNIGDLVVETTKGQALMAWEGAMEINAKNIGVTTKYGLVFSRPETTVTLNAANDIKFVSATYGISQNLADRQNVTFNSINGNLTISTPNSYGAYIQDKATFHAGKDITVDSYSYACRHDTKDADDEVNFTSDTGTIKLSNMRTGYFVVYETAGKTNFHGNTEILPKDGAGVRVAGGSVTFDKGLTIAAGTYSAIQARDAGKVTALDKNSDKKITGNLTMSDDATGAIQINLDTANSYLTGYAKEANTGLIDLDFANGATWNLTGNSLVNSVGWNGDTLLNMNYTGDGNYETLKAQNFTGTTGRIMMTTDLQSSKDTMNVQAKSDRIKIVDGSSGTYTIDIADASAIKGLAAEGYLLLIEDCYYPNKPDGQATFVAGNLLKGGIFKYKPIITNVDPHKDSGYSGVTTNVRPEGCGETTPPCPNTDHLWTKTSWYLTASEKTDVLTESVKPILGSGAGNYLNYRQEQDTLLQRLGELRNDENAQGIWARYKHGKNEINNVGLKNSQYSMFQLGYDYQTSKDKEGNRNLVGFAFNHSWGDQDYVLSATGTSGSNVFSLYDTWLGNKGHYWDVVAKAGRLYKDFDYPGDGYFSVADSGSDGGMFYSLSAEYGRKAFLGKDGWYAEPQTQLTYGRINGTDFTSDTLVHVNNAAINSLIGRIGFTVGKEISDGKENKTNAYGKLFWNREFKGDVSTHMTDGFGDSLDQNDDYSDSWGTVGFGITSRLNKKNDVYVDFEKTFGGLITTKWQVNAGARWKF